MTVNQQRTLGNRAHWMKGMFTKEEIQQVDDIAKLNSLDTPETSELIGKLIEIEMGRWQEYDVASMAKLATIKNDINNLIQLSLKK